MAQSFMHPELTAKEPKKEFEKGRRRKKEEILALLDEAVTDDDWREIWHKVASKAKNGDMTAAKLLADRKLGKPESNVNLGDGIGLDSVQFHFNRPDPSTIERQRQDLIDEAQAALEEALPEAEDPPTEPDVMSGLPILTGGRTKDE